MHESSRRLSASAITATVYLITGATRGIGYGLTERLASRPSTIVYAGARDVSKATKLHSLAALYGSHLRVLQLRSESDDDHATAVRQVQAEVGKVDVLIPNAGIADDRGHVPCAQIPIDSLRHHLEINALAPLRLYQHFLPLLARSPHPKYVVISSINASMAFMDTDRTLLTGYGTSKAAINHLTRRIHFEQPNLTAFPLFPGTVDTNMGTLGAKARGWERAPVLLPDAVSGIVKMVDEATRESHGGRFWDSRNGEQIPW